MCLPMTDAQRVFWDRFCAETGETGLPRGVDAFGDSEAMKDELLALVLTGRKRATATLALWFETDPEGPPKPDDLWLITDGRDHPACVIRTTSLDIRPVHAVDAQFARDEGEGDGSLDYWLTEHRAYYRREAEREGFEYSDDLPVLCERFELVWSPHHDKAPAAQTR